MPSPVKEPGAVLLYSVLLTSCDELETLAASPSVMFITRIGAIKGNRSSARAYHSKGLQSFCEGGIAALHRPRWLMMLTVVAVIFGIFAIGLIVLLIYKSTLTMHRDDQLFLDDASSHMHDEQTELLVKLNRLTIPVRVFSIGSMVFLLVLVGVWLYQGLNAV
jgi:hypothetical protein